MFYKNKV